MSAEKIDWSSFRKRILISKPIETVYATWATSASIEQWFLEKAGYQDENGNSRKPEEFVQAGDSFSWKWNNWNFNENGKILDANNKDKLSFTFGAAGNVHVSLRKSEYGTEVTLIQDNIPTDEKSKKDIYTGCATGWTFWLANLKAWLEHGITLHAKGLPQEETTDLVNS